MDKVQKEQLQQIIDTGFKGLYPGDTISKTAVKELEKLGYAVRNPKGYIFSSPKGEKAILE